LREPAEATSIHIVAPTGVYRDAYIPESLRELSQLSLAQPWIKEQMSGILFLKS
jgi:predicted metal-dependent phosphotriesterase family hydrolase